LDEVRAPDGEEQERSFKRSVINSRMVGFARFFQLVGPKERISELPKRGAEAIPTHHLSLTVKRKEMNFDAQ
jgi:hypothetical protein